MSGSVLSIRSLKDLSDTCRDSTDSNMATISHPASGFNGGNVHINPAYVDHIDPSTMQESNPNINSKDAEYADRVYRNRDVQKADPASIDITSNSKMTDDNVVTILRDFSENTSLVGWSHAVMSHRLNNRYRWKNKLFVFTILACVAMMVRDLKILLTDYLAYPVTTKVDINHTTLLDFPAVTFCGLQLQVRFSVKPILSGFLK